MPNRTGSTFYPAVDRVQDQRDRWGLETIVRGVDERAAPIRLPGSNARPYHQPRQPKTARLGLRVMPKG